MFIKSINSKYKTNSSNVGSDTKGEQVLISFFKDNKTTRYNNIVCSEPSGTGGYENKTSRIVERNHYYIRSNDKLFLEHYYYTSINKSVTENSKQNKVNKGDEIKSGVIYY